MMTQVCALRPGTPESDGECGAPSVFVLRNRHGEQFGACFEHLARVMEVMAPDAPLTAEPIFTNFPPSKPAGMTQAQYDALRSRHAAYKVRFVPSLFQPTFDLPTGYLAGWVGDRIYVGVSPEGDISS